MRRMLFLAIAAAIFAIAAFGFQNRGQQGARGQQPAPNADPYANNAAPGATQFPLAAPSGKDSNALNAAPPGAVNQGHFDPSKWKYGNAFDAPKESKIWNPVKLKMMQGGKVTGDGTIAAATFSVSAQKPVGKPEKGNFSYTAAGKVVVSTSITSVVVSGDHATIFGIATINGVGGYVFRLDVVDAGEPPATDSLRLRLSDGSDTGTQNLTSGNLQVH